jgi:hypothetical protein
MNRSDLIEKSATFSRAQMRIFWPCTIASIAAFTAWTWTTWAEPQREGVALPMTLFFLALIAAPIVVGIILLRRLLKRLHLECPRCHFLLLKSQVARIVLNTGNCPRCREKIINEAV